ncbi:MAG: universal stress protein [Polyangiaceae bacterium]|nr:universal stress protein [Polyangiaceae bacterium]
MLEKQIAAVEQRLRQQLHQLRGPRSTVDVEIVVTSGMVVRAVLETAMTRDATLIVVGKGTTVGVIAPTAEQIARQSPRSVLLVPAKWRRGARSSLLRPTPKRHRPVLRAAS